MISALDNAVSRRLFTVLLCIALGVVTTACSRTEVVESPRTTYVADVGEPKQPEIIWTSRTLSSPFHYLGQIKVRSWTYDGALSRLTDAAMDLRADAVIDIHYETVGFLTTFSAFAIKYK